MGFLQPRAQGLISASRVSRWLLLVVAMGVALRLLAMRPLRHARFGRQLTVWVPVAVAVGAAVWLGLLALVPEEAPPIVVAAVAVATAGLTWIVEQPFERSKKRREDEERGAEDARREREAEAARAEARRTELARRQVRVPAGPASLLSPARRLVPFLGRDRDLADLVVWCTTADPRYPSDVGYRLITAAGGVGKSRLAVELKGALADLPLDVGPRWQSVTVGRDQEAGFVADARDAYPDQPLLVVVDYADARPYLRGLLEEALDVDGTVRVLMLARTAGAWWGELTGVPGDLGALLAPAWAGADLADVDVSARVLIDAAAQAFAGVLDLPVPVVGVTGAEGARALDLTAASLVAVLRQDGPGSGAEQETVSVADVLDELLRHEAGHWETTARSAGLGVSLTGPMREVLLAAVALLGADDQEQATELVVRVMQTFSGQGPSTDLPDSERVAFWLKSTYPSTDPHRWVAPLQPDRLAEHLIITTLQHPDDHTGQRRKAALLENLAAAQAVNAMTVLARVVTDAARHDHHATIRDLADDLAAHLPADATTLQAVAAAIPYPSARMAPTGLLLAQRRLELARGHPENELDFARSLTSLGTQLSGVGRVVEAVSATEEAVATYRRLAEANPDRYEPDLARSLSNLGVSLWEVGRVVEAVPVIEEAFAAHRRLAEANPEQYEPELATSLSNLGVLLSEVGRVVEAVPVTEEAVATYRRLAEANPDRYEPELAASLTNFGKDLWKVGRAVEAVSATEEAVATYRRLAEANPDRCEPELAASLSNLGVLLSGMGRVVEAVSVIEEAVATYRRLAEANPDRYEPDLARSLSNLCPNLSGMGRVVEAVPVIEEAVATHRRLAEANPDRYEPD
ncbi:tetratricopeptide repeat protein, partial [Promicromonospora sp. NPDC057138]|uniref:tetratricopeptide repeat protein n=1 Tax=Promicromonospora sp. NPDC057138 TaxID=3346031 RepID=UPI003637BF7A